MLLLPLALSEGFDLLHFGITFSDRDGSRISVFAGRHEPLFFLGDIRQADSLRRAVCAAGEAVDLAETLRNTLVGRSAAVRR